MRLLFFAIILAVLAHFGIRLYTPIISLIAGFIGFVVVGFLDVLDVINYKDD